MTRRWGVGWGGVLVLLLVAVACLGVIAGVALTREPVPSAAARAGGESTVAVTQEEFADSRQVAASASREPAVRLTLGLPGRVTRSDCVAGGQVASGTSPVAVDGVPVLALYTTTPPWRDLEMGARGADVSALQNELVRLGYLAEADGVYGSATRAAVRALQAAVLGARSPSGLLGVSSVLWLPSAMVTIETCDAPLGVTDATAFATLTATASSVTVQVPEDATPGERVARVAGGTVWAPMDEHGVVTDPAFLSEVPGPASTDQAGQSGAGGLNVEIHLADPLLITLVPPAALYDLHGTAACMSTGGTARAVTVVSSALGQALVTFDDGPPPERVDLTPAAGVPCR